ERARGVTGGNMCNFVRHDADQFGFSVGSEDECAVHVQEAARETVGARHVAGVDDLDGEWAFRVGVADDLLAEPVYIVVDYGIVEELGAAVERGSKSLSQLPFTFCRIYIDAAADTPLADAVDIILVN